MQAKQPATKLRQVMVLGICDLMSLSILLGLEACHGGDAASGLVAEFNEDFGIERQVYVDA